jgi:hypothetical protein
MNDTPQIPGVIPIYNEMMFFSLIYERKKQIT